VPFYVDERVIVPRSYIGDFLAQGLPASPERVATVLDLCTGSGCLAILAHNSFPQARIDATDISRDALDVARINVDQHDAQDAVTLHHGDLFASVKGKTYDLILANPPYVAKAEADAFPPEYRAEPLIAHVSGTDGFDITRRILKDVGRHLNPGGMLVCEIGTGRDIIEQEFPDLAFEWLDTEQSSGEVFVLRQITGR
jgi:ribosomal protein L3 glutamine methyltransferase